MDDAIPAFPEVDPMLGALYAVLGLYVGVSLTIPLWVPILQKLTGQCGVFWVFTTLTYYAYLAWVIVGALLVLLLLRCPAVGLAWLAVLAWRALAFSLLGRRSPLPPTPGAVRATPPIPAEMLPADSGPHGLGRVVLVGNGPSIRTRALGGTIDSFDTVIRFNSFITRGLERHTGAKTSVWCHMMQWYHVCYAWNHVVLAPLFFVPGYLLPMLPARNAFSWSLGTYWRTHRFLGLRLYQVPTTGFVMLMRLLEITEGPVHLVGFDGFDSGSELHYYKERRMQLQVNAAGALLHDWGREQIGIRRLMEEGRIVLL